MVSTAVPAISMPSRLTVLKPGSVNVSEYEPGLRSMTRYWPDSSVTIVRPFEVRVGLGAATVTPGNTAPDASRTVPVRVPWANTVAGSNVMAASHRKHFTALDMSGVLLELFQAMTGAGNIHVPPIQGGRAVAIYASEGRK